MNRALLAPLVGVMLFGSCTYDKAKSLDPQNDPCAGLHVSYATDIKPIIESTCAVSGCHNSTSTNAGGPFTNYTQVKNKAVDIKTQVVSRMMPQVGSLTTAQIQLISCWVDGGAPNN